MRNERLELLLTRINLVLGGAECSINDLPMKPTFPLIFVVGAPRSGTTLLMQWLSSTNQFAVPSNLMSRFYAAPYIGGCIQKLICDPQYNFKDELSDLFLDTYSFDSHLGKTKGALQPNEFWYFWRRFIPNTDPEWITPEQEKLIKADDFLRGIAAIEASIGKPFASKAIILQYNLSCLKKIFNNVLFIHIKRNPLYTIQSLLGARTEYSGSEQRWFSVKPKEYLSIKNMSPIHQVAGQVYFTRTSIDKEFSEFDSRNTLSVDYEDFCQDPPKYYAQLCSKLGGLGYEMPLEYYGPKSFTANEKVVVSKLKFNKIISAYEYFSTNKLSAL